MRKIKKAAVLSACLLICLNMAAYPLTGCLAEDDFIAVDHNGNVIDVDEDDNDDDEQKEEYSGSFGFIRNDDGNAIITKCGTGAGGDLVIPNEVNGIKVAELDANALSGVGEEKIVLPASLEYISSENPFAPCENLKEIEVEDGNENYCSVDGVLFTKDMKTMICYPCKKSGSSFDIPDGVEEIGVAAMYGTELSSISVPSSVLTIRRHAFSFNENLKAIDMSSTQIEKVEAMTFVECTAITDVKLPATVADIAIAAFMGCEKLAEIELPESLTNIAQSAFQGTAIKSVRIPVSVREIGYNAFGYDIDENADPDFVIIGERGSAAQNYAVDKDSDYDYMNNFTFKTFEQADEEEELEALGVESSGYYQYTVSDGEVMIVSCVANESTLTVPDEIEGMKVTKIYKHAFSGCPSKEIVLPESVKSIGIEAFGGELESLTIPGGCTAIEGSDPFILCTALKELNVTEGDGEYASKNGVLYNNDLTLLIAYPPMKPDKSFKAPDTLEDICDYAFNCNQMIETVDLSSVKYIGDGVFEGCEKLIAVKLSKELKYVGSCAFLGCTALKGVHIYGDVEDIGDFSFGYKYDEELAQQADSSESSGYPYSVIEGFVIYTDEDTLAYKYAKSCGIETKSGTIQVGMKELSKTFIYVMSGLGGAVVLAAGVLAGKKAFSGKKKKKENGNEN